MINVLIADDQNFIRKTLESYLEAETDLNLVGFAENGQEAVNMVAQLAPDVVLMDIEMPVMDGLAATEIIAQQHSATKVLILSIHDRKQDVARALKLGAKGYWLKNTTAKELADAIRYVHKGYFQLALELVDKHFGKAKTSTKSIQELELSNKLRLVDTVLAQVEQKISSLEELTPRSLNETVEALVKQEMSLKRERDANLQYQLDHLRHQFERSQKKHSLTTKILVILNIISLTALIVLGYLTLAS